MLRALVLTAFCLVPAMAAAQAEMWQGKTAAFFGVHLIDTSTEGEINGVRPDETARTALVENYAATVLEEHGLTLVDLGPVSEALGRVVNPADCNGCAIGMARDLGADYAVVSEVQKVSNLILAMNLYIFDAATGAQLRGQAVDIRGNTDDSWLRGMRYILTRNVFAE